VHVMLSIGLIIIFSVVLFVYWFRYSCLLVLQNRTTSSTQYANSAALSFPSVQERLKSQEGGIDTLDQLHHVLSNDYRIVCFLLRCSAENDVDPIERRLLMLDYLILQAWYGMARRTAPLQARKALEEMSTIVCYFASSVGRHATQNARA
jgi:hypothetical protein